MRILDNVTSNIIKYANPAVPVKISSVEEGDLAGFLFENKILRLCPRFIWTGEGMRA